MSLEKRMANDASYYILLTNSYTLKKYKSFICMMGLVYWEFFLLLWSLVGVNIAVQRLRLQHWNRARINQTEALLANDDVSIIIFHHDRMLSGICCINRFLDFGPFLKLGCHGSRRSMLPRTRRRLYLHKLLLSMVLTGSDWLPYWVASD